MIVQLQCYVRKPVSTIGSFIFNLYKLPKQLVNATSLKLQNIILWNLEASKDIICRFAYWLEILISSFFQELCSIELLSLLSVQYVDACGMWACSLRFFHCLYNMLVIMADMAIFNVVLFSTCYNNLTNLL
jgi:hypothetical protein